MNRESRVAGNPFSIPRSMVFGSKASDSFKARLSDLPADPHQLRYCMARQIRSQRRVALSAPETLFLSNGKLILALPAQELAVIELK